MGLGEYWKIYRVGVDRLRCFKACSEINRQDVVETAFVKRFLSYNVKLPIKYRVNDLKRYYIVFKLQFVCLDRVNDLLSSRKS